MTVPKSNTFSDHGMYRMYDYISTLGNILFGSYLKSYHTLVSTTGNIHPPRTSLKTYKSNHKEVVKTKGTHSFLPRSLARTVMVEIRGICTLKLEGTLEISLENSNNS